MSELSEELRSMSVNRVGNLGHARHDSWVPSIDEAARHLAGWMHRLALEDDKPDAAASPFFVIGDVIVRRHAISMAERGKVRLKDDAIAKLNASNRYRTEDIRKSAAAGPGP
jgi:hypothetical protein